MNSPGWTHGLFLRNTRARLVERHNSEVGRGANNLGEASESRSRRFDLSEIGRRATEDVIELFVADCVSSVPVVRRSESLTERVGGAFCAETMTSPA